MTHTIKSRKYGKYKFKKKNVSFICLGQSDMNLASVAYFAFVIIKVTLHKTIRNNDFLRNNVALKVDAVKHGCADDFKGSFRAASL